MLKTKHVSANKPTAATTGTREPVTPGNTPVGTTTLNAANGIQHQSHVSNKWDQVEKINIKPSNDPFQLSKLNERQVIKFDENNYIKYLGSQPVELKLNGQNISWSALSSDSFTGNAMSMSSLGGLRPICLAPAGRAKGTTVNGQNLQDLIDEGKLCQKNGNAIHGSFPFRFHEAFSAPEISKRADKAEIKWTADLFNDPVIKKINPDLKEGEAQLIVRDILAKDSDGKFKATTHLEINSKREIHLHNIALHQFFDINRQQDTVEFKADKYIPTDKNDLPNKGFVETKNTEFDFSNAKKIDNKKLDHSFITGDDFKVTINKPNGNKIIYSQSNPDKNGFETCHIWYGKDLKDSSYFCIEPGRYNSPKMLDKEGIRPMKVGPGNSFKAWSQIEVAKC